ncbi:hypothetical protein EV363DRAFT_1302649 [Boletus edulis]|nr:hypothetical protein EV363DRAFT_1302649 [Boletus edulis]
MSSPPTTTTAYLYNDRNNQNITLVPYHLTVDLPGDLRALEVAFFASRKAGCSWHTPYHTYLRLKSTYLAIWDFNLQTGFRGLLPSPLLFFKFTSPSGPITYVTPSDITEIKRIVHILRRAANSTNLPITLSDNATLKIVQATFVERNTPSGFVPCHIVQQPGGNFRILNVTDYFAVPNTARKQVVSLRSNHSYIRFLCIYDGAFATHPDQCAYLFVAMEEDYNVINTTLNEIGSLSQALHKIIEDNTIVNN